MDKSNSAAMNAWLGILCGAGIGTLMMGPAIFAAIMSGGAGHGSYIAARALFPFSMLLTLLEGSIGPVSIAVGLLQFPLYGALIGWAVAMRTTRPAVLIFVHLIAALACFSGLLPNFS
ncbi:hypothetical protein [Flavisphingomonas formosensis]|uniref:hypothetical protein n=1 Tax=Flavisphingomonas formosensis TaxID=861534 RepID=UPI0012F9B1AE|nr:hypothetical protein [Sphingomonas formosensis]